ncbi:hypothetical protein SAMN06297129_2983 [Pseudooceanicola antarcticus]|uniref:Phage tail tube protein n=1 Tax=Pseudooceanicola antarcticus TaxID=1247613 RepID=A0A285J4U7_9RHOB|nr:phage tail tube protein [Pseudooceanicola antarcticus]PJE26813.1 hypothetical protein CVM39_15865 [Pseudooceanicola antarcticus]SNY55345.1 hypothetical protein SAMN06297129_2983 [Pseudooceanicola antarcticus]
MPGETELFGGSVERSEDGVTFTPVAKVTGVSVPTLTKNTRQRTTLDSPSKIHEYGEGFAEPGDLSISCLYDRAGFVAAKADEARAGGTFYRITLENGDTFDCLMITPVVEVSGLDQLDADATFTISGKTTGETEFTAGA